MPVTCETLNINKNNSLVSLSGIVRDGDSIVGTFKSIHESDGYYECLIQKQNSSGFTYVCYPDGANIEGLPAPYKVTVPSDGRKRPDVYVEGERVCTVDEAIKQGKFPRFIENVVSDCRDYFKAFNKEVENHPGLK